MNCTGAAAAAVQSLYYLFCSLSYKVKSLLSEDIL